MKLILVVLIFLFIYNIKIIRNAFKDISRRTWLLLFLILFSAFLLRFFVLPHQHFIYYDEFNHISMARAIQEHGIYSYCNFVSNDLCYSYTGDANQPGYHVLLSIVFDIFGNQREIAFNFNAFLSTVSIFFIFLLLYLWSKKENVVLIGTLIFSLIPVHLIISGSVSLMTGSLFFLVLTFVFFEIFLTKKGTSIFLLFLTSLLYTVYIRPENIFLILIFLIIFLLRNNFNHHFYFKENRIFYLLSFIIFFLLLIPAIIQIYLGVNIYQHEGWISSTLEPINYFLNHYSDNLYFFINPFFNPFLLVFFTIIGLTITFLKEKRAFFSFFLFFLFYFVLYSSYHLGTFYFYRDTIRYTLILYIPLMFFFVKGLNYFLSGINKKFKLLITTVFLIAFIVSSLLTIPCIFSPFSSRRTKLAANVELIFLSESHIPEDAYVVSVGSSVVYATIDRNAVTLNQFVKNNYYFDDKQVFLFKDFWWYYRGMEESDVFISENYNLNLIESINDGQYMLGIYEITRK